MVATATVLKTNEKNAIVEALANGLANVSITTMKAQFFHWNVTGMSFGSLHALFQEIYEDHFAAQDDIAERIRALGAYAPGSYAEFIERATLSEAREVLKAEDMVADMAAAQTALAQSMASVAEEAASQGDGLTEDLAIARAQVHEKFAWMLNAHIAA